MWLAQNHFSALTYTQEIHSTNQITDISALQFMRKLSNIMHIVSNGAAITLSGFGSGRYAGGYPTTSGSGRILKNCIRCIPS